MTTKRTGNRNRNDNRRSPTGMTTKRTSNSNDNDKSNNNDKSNDNDNGATVVHCDNTFTQHLLPSLIKGR